MDNMTNWYWWSLGWMIFVTMRTESTKPPGLEQHVYNLTLCTAVSHPSRRLCPDSRLIQVEAVRLFVPVGHPFDREELEVKRTNCSTVGDYASKDLMEVSPAEAGYVVARCDGRPICQPLKIARLYHDYAGFEYYYGEYIVLSYSCRARIPTRVVHMESGEISHAISCSESEQIHIIEAEYTFDCQTPGTFFQHVDVEYFVEIKHACENECHCSNLRSLKDQGYCFEEMQWVDTKGVDIHYRCIPNSNTSGASCRYGLTQVVSAVTMVTLATYLSVLLYKRFIRPRGRHHQCFGVIQEHGAVF